jgi:hypothetical protein
MRCGNDKILCRLIYIYCIIAEEILYKKDKMLKRRLTGLMLTFGIFYLPLISFAQKQQHAIKFMEFHGDFLGNLKADYNSSLTRLGQFGVGATVTVGKEFLGGFVEYDYRRVSLKKLNIAGDEKRNIHEFYLGIRYYTMRPTFMIGQMAVRINGGPAIGLDLEPNWRFMMFGGFALSPIRSTSGGSIYFVYRPGTLGAGGITLKPCWMIRVGIVIGPSMK